MPIRFLCPMGHRLKVPDERAGKKGRCPICQQRVVIPVEDPQSSGKPKRTPFDDLPESDVTMDDEADAPAIGRVSTGSPVLEHIVFGRPPDEARYRDPVPERPAAPQHPIEEMPYVPIRLDSPPIGSPPRPLPQEATAPPSPPDDVPYVPIRLDGPINKATPPAAAPIPPAPEAAPPTESRAVPLAPPGAFENIGGLVDQISMAPPSAPPPPPPAFGAPATDPPRWPPHAAYPPQEPPRAAFPSPGYAAMAPSGAAPPYAPAMMAPAPFVRAAAPEVYEPEPAWVQTVYFLAVGLVVVTLFCAAPATKHLNLAEAPGWARIVLLLSALQLVYIAWMVSLPDWSTVWVGMLVFAIVASIYGMGMAIVMATPRDRPLMLGMDAVRYSAAGWCLAVVLLTSLMTYFCGRISFRWRRAFEVAKAKRNGNEGK